MTNSPPSSARIDEAEKVVGTVLESLEEKTGGEVRKIALEDMVDTDAQTGKPVIKKAVEIELKEKPPSRWST